MMANLWDDYYCDGGYLIPYEFSEQFPFFDEKRTITREINKVKEILKNNTQIRLTPVNEFLRKTGLKDAFADRSINEMNCKNTTHMCHKIVFSNNGMACSSLVGKNGGMMAHSIDLGAKYCHTPINILHELLHAFSFMHEHTRPGSDIKFIINHNRYL